MTALQLDTNNTATSTLSTAKSLVANAGSTTSASNATKVGTSTGYGEIYSGGNGANWPASGSLGSPSGNGCLYDSTALEGQTFFSGNWSAQLRLHGSLAGITADLYLRIYKRSSGGTYTLIGTLTAPGTVLSTSNTNYTFSAVSLSSITFNTGDKLYVDFWANVTTNTSGNGGTQFSWDAFCTVANTGDSRSFLVSPGYYQTIVRTIPSSAALLATSVNTVPASAALLATSARQIPSTTALLATLARQIPASAAVLATSVRQIPATGALLTTQQRTVPSSAAVLATVARAIPASAAMLATPTRTIPSTVSLTTTGIRAIPASGALLATSARSISCTVALEQIILSQTSILYGPSTASFIVQG